MSSNIDASTAEKTARGPSAHDSIEKPSSVSSRVCTSARPGATLLTKQSILSAGMGAEAHLQRNHTIQCWMMRAMRLSACAIAPTSASIQSRSAPSRSRSTKSRTYPCGSTRSKEEYTVCAGLPPTTYVRASKDDGT